MKERLVMAVYCGICGRSLLQTKPPLNQSQNGTEFYTCSHCNRSITISSSPHVISKDTYTKLIRIPETVSNLEEIIDFLIKFYYENTHLSKAQEILMGEN